MSNTTLARGIKYYWEQGYYTLSTVKSFFNKQSNFDNGYLVESDFEAITGISLEFYTTHKDEIKSLKYTAFQTWFENYKVDHPEEFETSEEETTA